MILEVEAFEVKPLTQRDPLDESDAESSRSLENDEDDDAALNYQQEEDDENSEDDDDDEEHCDVVHGKVIVRPSFMVYDDSARAHDPEVNDLSARFGDITLGHLPNADSSSTSGIAGRHTTGRLSLNVLIF